MKMKKILILVMFILLILSCNQTKTVQDNNSSNQKEKLFEHYFNYNMYSNYKMPIKTHDELINLVAKENNFSAVELQKMYEEYYMDWYNERIKNIK